MGSPFGPVLANRSMGYHEKRWLETHDAEKVLFYGKLRGRHFLLISI